MSEEKKVDPRIEEECPLKGFVSKSFEATVIVAHALNQELPKDARATVPELIAHVTSHTLDHLVMILVDGSGKNPLAVAKILIESLTAYMQQFRPEFDIKVEESNETIKVIVPKVEPVVLVPGSNAKN